MATRARENARERRLEEEEEEENEGTSSRLAVVACRDDAEEAEGKKEGEASKIGGTEFANTRRSSSVSLWPTGRRENHFPRVTRNGTRS